MATVTGMTAAAMQAIRDGTVVSAAINGSGHLILTKHDGTTVDAGVAVGPAGAAGAAGPAGPSTLASGTQITWGADVNLYRSAADILKTDDAFVAALGYSLGAPLAAPAYQAQQIAAQTFIRNKLLGADANDSFHILGDGKHEWGAGGATAVDTNLYRSAADTLKTDDAFVSVLGVSVPALVGTPAYIAAQVAAQTVIRNKLLTADANDSFHILGDGKHEWGAGGATAVDTNLYRSAADTLKTDDSLKAVGTITALSGTGNDVVLGLISGKPGFSVGSTAGWYELSAGNLKLDSVALHVGAIKPDQGNAGASAGIIFGSALDTNLYRSAADTLKTDDTFAANSIVLASNSLLNLYNPSGNIIATDATQVYVSRTTGASKVIIGQAGPSSEPGIALGSSSDTNLYRSAADTLKTDDSLIVGGNLSVTGSFSPNSVSIAAIVGTPAYAAAQVAAQTLIRNKFLAADANDAFHILGDGKLEWGDGGANTVDANLYRSAASVVKTDGWFRVGLNTVTNVGLAGQVSMGDVGPSSQAGIKLGSAGDTNLYRSAADTLKTDDSILVAGGIGSSGMTPNTAVSFFGLRTASQILLANNISSVSDSNASFIIQGDGKHEWGPGTVSVRDTNLYRSSADSLKTDDNFSSAIDGYFRSGAATLVIVGGAGPSSQAGLQFGSAGDTNLYRSAADTLATDDTFKSTVASGVDAINIANSGARITFGANGYITGAPGQVNVFGALVVQNDSIYFNSGPPIWQIAALAQTTVGAAGAASALPATPTKYLKVKDSAGTTLVIPAYAAV